MPLINFSGSESNRTSVSSLLSISSFTGRSTYNLNKQSTLDKLDSFRKSSMDISSSSAKNMKNFISGVVTPRLVRKPQHSASSDTLKSESTENMSQVIIFQRIVFYYVVDIAGQNNTYSHIIL